MSAKSAIVKLMGAIGGRKLFSGKLRETHSRRGELEVYVLG
jgi:hypothetical protein